MSQELDVSKSMRELADSYGAVLSAQFRTLSLLTKHAGEVGRAHEFFLRDVLRRFLPNKLRIGTGFISAPNSFSSQQDIINCW